jgi:hypothetical protein
MLAPEQNIRLARRGEHDAFHLRMFETDALQSVVQLDVYAQVVELSFSR